MRFLRSGRGQSTAEYAVLFAIVIGAAIAMQQFIKSRLQGAVKNQMDAYQHAAGDTGTFEPVRTATSQSASDVAMDSATVGTINTTSGSESSIDKTKDTVTAAGPGPGGPGPGGPGPGGPGPAGH